MLSIAQERSPKYADKFLDKVKPLLVEPKVGRRSDGRLFVSFSQSSIWSYVIMCICICVYSVAIQYLYTINGRYQVLGIPICYTEYVARRELRVRKSTVYLLPPKGQQKCSRWCFHDA